MASKWYADLEAFQERIQISFHDISLLEEALTHGSYANENTEMHIADNQRLEFLGDAILDFVVGEWLFHRYRDAQEGDLTRIRARVVRTAGLAALAREIGLGDYLRLGKGENLSGGRRRAANLCAAFEALVGAIYLDQGMERVRAWIHSFLQAHAAEIDAEHAAKDAKTLLQEYIQANLHLTPSYRIIHEEGPDHAKVFTSQALVGDRVWGEGRGPSKQAAEIAAAEAALRTHAPSCEDADRCD